MLAVPGSQLGSRISSKLALLFWTWARLVMVDKRWYQSFLMQVCERGSNLPCQRQNPKSEQIMVVSFPISKFWNLRHWESKWMNSGDLETIIH
jgi:hypothetical protein